MLFSYFAYFSLSLYLSICVCVCVCVVVSAASMNHGRRRLPPPWRLGVPGCLAPFSALGSRGVSLSFFFVRVSRDTTLRLRFRLRSILVSYILAELFFAQINAEHFDAAAAAAVERRSEAAQANGVPCRRSPLSERSAAQ